MSIKRYTATADNTITNALESNLVNRATGSNAGAADVVEIFSIYGQATTSSAEKSRALVQFDMSQISSDRTAGSIPASGSVSFYLKMFNTEHIETTPRNFTLAIQAVSQSWEEGNGLDLDSRTDLTYNNVGSNWIKRSGNNSWVAQGGDFHATPVITASFDKGTEDLEVDVTSLVEEWIAGTKDNYGFGIFLSGSYESGTVSYYTKKFFARSSEFFFKRPVLEARFNDDINDDRGNFYSSSSLAPASDNLNTLYLHNYVRGRLRNIPSIGTGNIFVDLYQTLGGTAETLCISTPATGGYVSTGIYSCSVCVSTTATTLRDVWHNGSGTQFHTGTISVNSFASEVYSTNQRYVLSISNMKSYYSNEEVARFRLYARRKDWSPTIYTVASATPENLIIPSASYEICRSIDGERVIPFGTGSDLHTGLAYDVSGNYFDLDLSLLEAGYSYDIKLAFYNDSVTDWEIQPYNFRFKVRENEY
jgi:hypothetical protein